MKAKDDATKHAEGDAAAEKKTSRRGFTKSVAAALAAAPVALSNARARQRPAEPKAPPNPQPTPTTAAPQQQQPPSPVAEAYAAVARARFGEHLSAEEFERVRRDLAGNVRAVESLAKSKLNNSDEPDFVFGA